MVQRQTIVHNVSDEPITVEQTDGSHITVPARGKRPANLPSEVDFRHAVDAAGSTAAPKVAASPLQQSERRPSGMLPRF